MIPSSAPTSAAAGSVTQNGAFSLTKQNADRERACRDQSGVSERDLAGIAREQHQRERADAGEKNLAGEVELEGRRDQRESEQREHERDQPRALGARGDEGQVRSVAGTKIAAGDHIRDGPGRALSGAGAKMHGCLELGALSWTMSSERGAVVRQTLARICHPLLFT